MSPLLKFALCAVILCVEIHAKDFALPATIKTCKRDSEDYSSCLRLAIQESWPTIIKGFPELNFPPLDPHITEVASVVYEEGNIRGRGQLRNVTTYGMAKMRFLSVRPHFDDDRFGIEIDTALSKIFMEGLYKVEGALGPFKIGGKGYFNLSAEDIRTTWDIEGIVKNDRWIVEHFTSLPEIGKMKVYFSDLFNGNTDLTRAALDFLNEYWPLLYQAALPIAAETWDEQMTELMNRFFSRVPFSSLFP